MTYHLTTPLTQEDLAPLRAGDRVLLSGVLYTGRDAAHRRLAEALGRGEPLPVDLRGQAIYYVGPCPAPPGFPVGSCGPTTSGRVDAYTPLMLEQGLMAMIGKGFRTAEVVEAMVRHGAVYFSATGGAGALIARRVVACDVVAYGDLGTEAIHRMQVKDFPLVVAIDSRGVSLYEEGPKAYRREGGDMTAPPQATSETPRVRPGRPEEADALLAIVRRTVAAMQAAGLDQWDEHYPGREEVEDDLARGALLVLEQHGAPAALLTLDTWQPPEHEGQPWRCTEGVCNIHRVMVDPALQSQGLGSRLMQAALQRAKEAGYAAVHMDTLQGNAGARRFYVRLGFEERGTTISAYMGGKAYTLLEKCL